MPIRDASSGPVDPIPLRLDPSVRFEGRVLAQYKALPRTRRQQWLREILRLGLAAVQSGATVSLSADDLASSDSSNERPTVIPLRLDKHIDFERALLDGYNAAPKSRRREWMRGIIRNGLQVLDAAGGAIGGADRVSDATPITAVSRPAVVLPSPNAAVVQASKTPEPKAAPIAAQAPAAENLSSTSLQLAGAGDSSGKEGDADAGAASQPRPRSARALKGMFIGTPTSSAS